MKSVKREQDSKTQENTLLGIKPRLDTCTNKQEADKLGAASYFSTRGHHGNGHIQAVRGLVVGEKSHTFALGTEVAASLF